MDDYRNAILWWKFFHHKIGSDAVTHVRTVWHPLITTPNDNLALSPSSFLITNDHYFREEYMNFFEDVNWLCSWANVGHIRVYLPAGEPTIGDESSTVEFLGLSPKFTVQMVLGMEKRKMR